MAWRRDGLKLVRGLADAEAPDAGELYDLRADPGERRDLAAERPELRARLEAELAAQLAELGGLGRFREDRELPPELRGPLEELGYLEAEP